MEVVAIARRTAPVTAHARQGAAVCTLVALCLVSGTASARAQEETRELTQPVNDFAHVIDPQSARELDTLIRSLQQASGDVVVVATIPTFKPFGDVREYAVKMFENHGRGIGEKGKDNGLLVLLAVNDRKVWIEVGYGLEEFVTDIFSGETSRQYMAPEFKKGEYGRGLVAGVSRIANRIAERKSVELRGVVRQPSRRPAAPAFGGFLPLGLIVLFLVLRAVSSRGRRRRRWYSGVGPFGGGFGGFGGLGGGGGFGGGFGGFGGGGGGGGFGGFGGGRSGGGGGGASW